MDILDLVEAYRLEEVATHDFGSPLGFETPGLQLHLYSNTSANLEVVNIEKSRIWEFAQFSCFHVICEGIGPIAE